MIDQNKNNVVTKGIESKPAVKELKRCPKCKQTVEAAGKIRCLKCNVLMLNEKEFQFQNDTLHFSERGKDDDLYERNEAKKKEQKEGN